MKIWFQCKIKYQKEDENGRLKNQTEPYLVDAVSYTEAEARIYQELGSVIRGEFEVTSITKSKISDIFHYDDADQWHHCFVTYIAVDDVSGKEKKVTNQMLVTAADLKQACERLIESLGNLLVTYKIVKIQESPIVEIFPYHEDEKADNEPEAVAIREEAFEAEAAAPAFEKEGAIEATAEDMDYADAENAEETTESEVM